MKEIISIAKALSDENRIKALALLRNREICVCRIVEFLKLAPSTVSKHMSILKAAGLVESRKEEKWIYYRLPDSADRDTKIQRALEWVFGSLSKDEKIIEDSENLIKILKQSPEVLCKKRVERKRKQKIREANK